MTPLTNLLTRAAAFDRYNPSCFGDTSPYNTEDANYDGALEENTRLQPLLSALAAVAVAAERVRARLEPPTQAEATKRVAALDESLAALRKVCGE